MRHMKNRTLLTTVLLLFCCSMLAGCLDPVFPEGDLEVEIVDALTQGSSVDIEIRYPSSSGLGFSWKEQSIQVLQGHDVVAASGLTITGLKTGTAIVKVSATAYCGFSCGEMEKEYSVETEVRVE